MTNPLRPGDALLIVDVQNDFCPGGAVPIPNGHRIVPVLNQWIQWAQQRGAPLYASRDWHPARHVSFREYGGSWPPHCVQGSKGAELHPELRLPAEAILMNKGTRPEQDASTAFDETGLAQALLERRVERIFVGGLPLDSTVKETVLRALEDGFSVTLIPGGSRPFTEEGGRKAVAELRQRGANVSEAFTAAP